SLPPLFSYTTLFRSCTALDFYFMINLLFLMIVLSANLIQFVLSLSVLYFSSTFLFMLIAACVPLISLMARIISPLLICLTSCLVYVMFFRPPYLLYIYHNTLGVLCQWFCGSLLIILDKLLSQLFYFNCCIISIRILLLYIHLYDLRIIFITNFIQRIANPFSQIVNVWFLDV